MEIKRTVNQKHHSFTLTDKEMATAYREHSIKKMQSEVLLWDLEFSVEDALVIATKAFERFERNSVENRRDCLVIEADNFRKEQTYQRTNPLQY